MLRAFPVARESNVALPAILRQGIELVIAEAGLLGGVDHLAETLIHDVAQAVFRIDIMVATIEIAIVLDGQRRAALFREDAEARSEAHPVPQGHVEQLDEDAADVLANPFVENGAEESAVLFRFDAPIRHRRLRTFGRGKVQPERVQVRRAALH